MFINNKYSSWYWSLINRAQARSIPAGIYKERHHIIPRCMGGSNQSVNLVYLTAKEHYIVHLLLPHMVTGRDKYKLQVAFWRMCSTKKGRHIPCNRMYEIAKLQMASALSELNTGKILPILQREALKGRTPHNKGKKMPSSHGEKIAQFRDLNPTAWADTSNKISVTMTGLRKKQAELGLNKCPKFKWTLQNTKTQIIEETTNLKEWCSLQGFSTAMIYRDISAWKIIAKFRLRDNLKLI